jgi:ricin-type beta-trefoil lectin protein
MIRRDERGSLPLAMLLTVIGVGATILLGGVLVPQLRTTGTDVRRATEIDAAQAGIEAALGQIRATLRDGDGTGDRSALPCTSTAAQSPDATLTGPVSAGSPAAYRVGIYYLPTKPPTGAAAESWAKANRLACTVGAGVPTAPAYALLVSTGTAVTGSTGRTLTAAYLFQSRTRANVPGGAIKVYDSDLCFAAPVTAAAGDQLILRTCDTADPLQGFAYQPDLHVQVLTTGLCLQADPIDHARVTFQTCSDSARTQIWSLNNRDNFEGTTDGQAPDGKCFNVDYSTTPPSMVINNVIAGDPTKVVDSDGTDGTPCSGTSGDYTDYKAFFPDAKAGTGAAGARTGQLVNYDQFGRCLDVTANKVTYDFMVIFPCKQRPAGDIQWNQVWHLPDLATGQSSAAGRIYTHNTADGKDYCLYSPGSTAAQVWVKVTPCTVTDPAIPPDQLWVRRDATGDATTSYRLESTYGTSSSGPFCLQPTGPGDTDGYWDQFTAMTISKLVLRACDASNAQKWNASPTVLSSVIRDFREN